MKQKIEDKMMTTHTQYTNKRLKELTRAILHAISVIDVHMLWPVDPAVTPLRSLAPEKAETLEKVYNVLLNAMREYGEEV